MATPEKLSIKFVESLPASAGGFGGGHAKDLTPIIKQLQTKPGTWALIAEAQKSMGALQRLPDFDCPVHTTKTKTEYRYRTKGGEEKVGFLIDVYAKFEKGSTAKRDADREARKKSAEAKGAPKPVAKR